MTINYIFCATLYMINTKSCRFYLDFLLRAFTFHRFHNFFSKDRISVVLLNHEFQCFSPLHGCPEPESCCTSRSEGRAGASFSPETTPSQLHGETTMETVTMATSRLSHRDPFSDTDMIHVDIRRGGKQKNWICSPKYTVLLHLGQILGPPEKDEKLAAAKASLC